MGFPDKEPVRRALMDAAKEKYGHLVEGRAGVHAKRKETDGWALTPEGVTWIRENEERIKSILGTTRSMMPFVDALRFKVRMHEQPLFRRFLEKEKLEGQNLYNFTGMLNTSPGAPKEEIAMKFRTLCSKAELVGDQQIISFLEACAQAFSTVLTSTVTKSQSAESNSTDLLL
jgi:hypothetical protein